MTSGVRQISEEPQPIDSCEGIRLQTCQPLRLLRGGFNISATLKNEKNPNCQNLGSNKLIDFETEQMPEIPNDGDCMIGLLMSL